MLDMRASSQHIRQQMPTHHVSADDQDTECRFQVTGSDLQHLFWHGKRVRSSTNFDRKRVQKSLEIKGNRGSSLIVTVT